MTAFLAPDPIQSTQFIPGGNTPASGGLLFCYQVGSSTKQNTYTDPSASTARTNPIVLDSGGNIPGNGEVWITSTAKFVLAPSNDTDPPVSPYWSRDNLPGVNDPSQVQSEWIPTTLTPTFVNASTFILGGDQTSIFTAQRRIKTINTAGTLYSTVTSSVFGTSTTIGIASDSLGLDNGLSSVSYGILNPFHDSIPGTVSVLRFGAKGDGITDDTAAISSAIAFCDPGGPGLYAPGGTYLLTSPMPAITGQFSLRGDGRQETTFLYRPSSASTACFTVNNGASLATQIFLKDFGIKSDNNSTTKIALDLYDISVCEFSNLFIYGSISGGSPNAPYWTGNGSIGIRTHGREAVTVRGIEICADIPVQVAANPNSAATNCEDMDHWHWEDCYLLSSSNPIFNVSTGLGVQNLTFSGYQAWVGGAGGFLMNDTRVAPTIASHNLTFMNVRGEQGVSSSAFWFSISCTQPLQQLGFYNVEGDSTTQGIFINGGERITLDRVTMATANGKISLSVSSGTNDSVIDMRSCNWQLGSVMTLQNYATSYIFAFNTTDFQGPNTALFYGIGGNAGAQLHARAVGFYGTAAVTTQPNVGGTVTTTPAVSTTPWGFSTSSQANALINQVSSIAFALKTLGLSA